MSIKLRKKSSSLVATPSAVHAQLFIDLDDSLKIKDSGGSVSTIGGAAEKLGTTGSDVTVGTAAAPSTGQVLTATSATTATWQTPGGASGSAGGDLAGTYPNPTVTQARGLKSATTTISVAAATAPTPGQVLTATSGTTATWQTPSGGSPTGSAGGDLSGTYPNPAVVLAPALKSATTTVNVSAATAPTSGQVLTATSSTAATWQAPAGGAPSGAAGGDLSGTYPNPTVVLAPALKSATTTVNVGAATAPSAGQVLTATSGTAATWQVPLAASIRNSVWDPPLVADSADEEFTADPFLGGSWTVFEGGVPSTRAGNVDPKSNPASGTYRSTLSGSTVYVQLPLSSDCRLAKAVPSPISGDQLWMAGLSYQSHLNNTANSPQIYLFASADNAGAPDSNNIIICGVNNTDSTNQIDFLSGVTSGGVFTLGPTFINGAMAISGMPGFFIRKGASQLTGSGATSVNVGMFSPFGTLSCSTEMTSFTGNWAWAGFSISTLASLSAPEMAWGQIFGLHFIRRKLAADAYLFG